MTKTSHDVAMAESRYRMSGFNLRESVYLRFNQAVKLEGVSLSKVYHDVLTNWSAEVERKHAERLAREHGNANQGDFC